jgi:hypothetical protein
MRCLESRVIVMHGVVVRRLEDHQVKMVSGEIIQKGRFLNRYCVFKNAQLPSTRFSVGGVGAVDEVRNLPTMEKASG